jgi:hypothetical protein
MFRKKLKWHTPRNKRSFRFHATLIQTFCSIFEFLYFLQLRMYVLIRKDKNPQSCVKIKICIKNTLFVTIINK